MKREREFKKKNENRKTWKIIKTMGTTHEPITYLVLSS